MSRWNDNTKWDIREVLLFMGLSPDIGGSKDISAPSFMALKLSQDAHFKMQSN
jgi:hypothetical protein